jgi:hypothetical protein
MKQLSGLDNASLIGEPGNVFKHVGTLLVYDSNMARDGKVRYKNILGPWRGERIVAARREARRAFNYLANAGAAPVLEVLHGRYCVEH